MELAMKDLLRISYLRIRVDIQFLNNCELPVSKTSAIRGGIGDAMLRIKCTNEGNCEGCDLNNSCDVRNFMYSQIENAPPDMKTNPSLGYVIECEDYSESFEKDDQMKFYVILFGENISRISLLRDAIIDFGKTGLGVHRSKFEMIGFTDDDTGQSFLEQDLSDESMIKGKKVIDYVEKRIKRLEKSETYLINFKTAVTIKENGTILKDLTASGLCNSLLRRIYMLNMYEHITDKPPDFGQDHPVIVRQNMRPIAMPRFSGAKNQKMYLNGIKGSVVLSNVSDEWLALLLAGELLHVGKNTSFGFGRYTVKELHMG
ncbi:MAG: CRISPR system precrRNA processing endoribonuclease RAMP protein Cas6 [Lachnospiraceae bacterium]|nr:CRISPR system precrRNA processing endoribonuclease RAMP protein Cas6 [Lachnospiraceae bacterium]